MRKQCPSSLPIPPPPTPQMFTLTGFLNISSMMAVPVVGLVLVPALAPAFYQRHSGAMLAVKR